MTTAAVSTEYISEAELKNTLELSGTNFADGDIPAAITAASRGIDEACQRWFYPASQDTDRYYTPLTAYQVMIDDLYDLTTLATDQDGDSVFEQAWTENTDFTLDPLNAAADSWPWTRVCLHPLSLAGGFPYWYPRSVKVTGRFGWPSIPGPIVQATTILATQLLKRAREAPFGIVAIGIDVGATARIAVTDPSIRFLIEPYRREKPL